MRDHTRAAVAVIAAAVTNKKKYDSVYDHTKGAFLSIEAKSNGSRVDAYDYGRSAFIDGNLPDLFDYTDSAFIEMKFNNNKIEGYDFGSSSFYECTVDQNEIEVYDFDTGSFHMYSAS